MASEKLIGKVSHYYGKAGVAIVDLKAGLEIGQTIHFKGARDDFTQTLNQMQYEHEEIKKAKKGQSVGIKVDQKVHENVEVLLVE